MDKYAVIRIKKNQYILEEGDSFLVPGICNEKVESETLLLVKDGKVSIGKPVLDKVSLKFKVIEEKVKGDKINVLKYKAKSRYRKKFGFRSISTKLLLEKIN